MNHTLCAKTTNNQQSTTAVGRGIKMSPQDMFSTVALRFRVRRFYLRFTVDLCGRPFFFSEQEVQVCWHERIFRWHPQQRATAARTVSRPGFESNLRAANKSTCVVAGEERPSRFTLRGSCFPGNESLRTTPKPNVS